MSEYEEVIKIDKVELKKWGARQVIILNAIIKDNVLKTVSTIPITYIMKKASVDCIIEDKDTKKINDLLCDKYNLNNIDFFQEDFSIESLKGGLKKVIIPFEHRFIDIFKMHSSLLKSVFKTIFKNRFETLEKVFINNREDCNVKVCSTLEKKYKKDNYTIAINVPSNPFDKINLSMIQGDRDLIADKSKYFDFILFKGVIKEHLGVVMSIKHRGGLLTIQKNGIIRSNIRVNILDRLTQDSIIYLDKKNKDTLEEELLIIFECIKDILNLISKKSIISI